MELADMIQNSLDKSEQERKEIARLRKLKRENSGYNVQYCPCGHSRELQWNEYELVEKAKRNKNLDALILPIEQCPFCKRHKEWISFFTPKVFVQILAAMNNLTLVNLSIIGNYAQEFLTRFPDATYQDFVTIYQTLKEIFMEETGATKSTK